MKTKPLLKGPFTMREDFSSKRATPALTHFPFPFCRRVYKAARVTRVGGLPYLGAWVTLLSGLVFSLVNAAGRATPLPPYPFPGQLSIVSGPRV